MVNKLKDLLSPYYTKQLDTSTQTVYDLFTWHTIDVNIKDYKTGASIIHMENLEFPTHFSSNACDIIASKYFRKNGLPEAPYHETSFKQVVHRMVNFWVIAALDEGLIDETERQTVYNELAYMMLSQMWAPNSPQWFNTGLQSSYGITGPSQGHFYYDTTLRKVVEAEDAYSRTQGSACFIVSVEDSLLGPKSLTDQLTTETRLFKYGSGVGSNWSSIRGKGEKLSGGGMSSGLMSFLKVFDRNAGAIKSGGTTRRAAKMNILNIDHPEIEDFVNWKAYEEDKVEALGKMGYDTHFDGEAYETVSGQNANNSVRISDAFMKLIHDEEASYPLIGRLEGNVLGTVSPKALYEKMSYGAWRCGDPGVQFDDTINAWHTCPAGEDGKAFAPYNRINASNPCSEYMFLDDTACNLASINITQFYNVETNTFDLEGYMHCIKMVQIVLEATIHHGQFPTPEIARRSHLFRTTGLGLTNLGALFMLMGLPYDSEEARQVGASLMSLLTGYSYYVSSLFAKEIGAFECFEANKSYMLKVLYNHAKASAPTTFSKAFKGLNYSPLTINHELLNTLGLKELGECLTKTWKMTLTSGENYGFRNAQVSVLAPTGTIAFAMDCATTSSEPFFSHVVYKKLVGGSSMEIVNPLIPTVLKKLGYTEEEITAITDYILRKEDKGDYRVLLDGKIEGAPYLKEEHYAIFDTANKCGSGERYIPPMGHVKMMAALTPHVSGAISKTVNLPNTATVADVAAIYEASWQLGVKAIALYRDGCKVCQPLTTTLQEEEASTRLENLSYQELLAYAKSKVSVPQVPLRVKPTGIRNAHVHEAEIGGLKLYITVSFYEDGRLGEVYVSAGRQGSLVKGLLDSISTTVSEMLQYGVPARDIASMYRGQKYEPSGFVYGHPYIKMADSISDLISKIIDSELGDFTYCQVKPEASFIKTLHDSKPSIPQQKTLISPKNLKSPSSQEAATLLYGETCPTCKSSRLIKNGTCKVCMECGTTTGCS
ncbi:ribonucleoside-diphosphate reductase, adenosylcobalamin-dependent [Sporanaerobium hydrogeniformans]|uniref:Ribonucleoside-diphosphate reductase, adenosylcobalamin-dependent n=1 Tax=Sporanaerobium hydrogeniformans TaxID=3072179 RepID=A0AC61DE21_9FIRM|nr:vitamin B12-dependent ribonucleotide reductase [Sporanaerobium hydrogeniformans]PHV70897.1 ribonucleoside-diphosphate reductase, adenosylcobalamin-dependent [Sporanaerobium hydrogeniformans]